MSIHIDSCAGLELVVVKTHSSMYELIIPSGGKVLVRGGRHLADFTPVEFLGSTAADGSLAPRTIDVGLRMRFIVGDRFVITSAVQSFSRCRASAASTGVCRGQAGSDLLDNHSTP